MRSGLKKKNKMPLKQIAVPTDAGPFGYSLRKSHVMAQMFLLLFFQIKSLSRSSGDW